MNTILRIGICNRPSISVNFHGDFTDKNGKIYNGKHTFSESIFLSPKTVDSIFELYDITIGINFHWQRNENQCFTGALECKLNEGMLIAINHIELEDYLHSVIASEMNAKASLNLLKAHAVISRSWALAQVNKELSEINGSDYPEDTENKHIKWYGHENHKLFDLCADDHCQRYQGITRINSEVVKQAVKETEGEILVSDNRICDTRFYKCCGGLTELYENTWDEHHHPYLISLTDSNTPNTNDLSIEQNAVDFIESEPDAFCNTKDKTILSQVLNDYDLETNDFYRWKVEYTQQELSSIVKERSGIDFGNIQDLIPIKRGASGRIIELKIIGTKKTMIIGKELEIRKYLSHNHLYSSAFIVKRTPDNGFVFHGAGWGHGVGLCQIGAAVMADKGYNYRQILAHYYPNSEIKQINIY
ncbi:MAG TPA: SpoIID/LytB domain-containing protein [Candidatus Enterocola sp.]|nr:SpoIID/LytB domain-containing protein [Candidatus Enterocola sp.]